MYSSQLEIPSPNKESETSVAIIDENEEPFSLNKFLSPPMEGNEASLFLSWLQNRLREYYHNLVEHYRCAIEKHEFGPILSMDEADICFSQLKVIEIAEESHWMKSHWVITEKDATTSSSSKEGRRPPPPTHIIYDDGCVVKGVQCKFNESLPYETGVRRFAVAFQKKGVNSLIQTLHLVMEVGEVHDVELFGKISPPFISTSEKHSIDMYNILFPTLQGFLYAKKSEIHIPIPTCYYARYEENDKIDVDNLLEQQQPDGNLVTRLTSLTINDIDTQKETKPKVVESHRILILRNVGKYGFMPKNVDGTSFLSLMNVTFGLKEIAKLHAVSWAFTKLTKKPLQESFPFLELPDFMPYFKTLLSVGFPVLTVLCENYFEKHEAEDKQIFLERMQFIFRNVIEILSKLYPPQAIDFSSSDQNPVTLLHHGLCYSTALFRHNHTLQKAENDEGYQDVGPSTSGPSTSSSSPNILIERELRLVDWKSATFGSPMFDVAFFFLTSLPPKARHHETAGLLKLYAEEFTATATLLGHAEDIKWNWDDLKADYEKGLLYGCLLIASNLTRDRVVTENDMDIFVQGMRDVIPLKIV